jgi:hypothetical protein
MRNAWLMAGSAAMIAGVGGCQILDLVDYETEHLDGYWTVVNEQALESTVTGVRLYVDENSVIASVALSGRILNGTGTASGERFQVQTSDPALRLLGQLKSERDLRLSVVYPDGTKDELDLEKVDVIAATR